MPTISIAMATYNGARFLREQLDSLAAQTLLPIELVITDDGSNDDTLAILADFARTAPFPVHVHGNTERLGYKANFMHCASLCTGDLIAFCDQDDIWLPQKLATQAASFANPTVLLSSHNAMLIDKAGQKLDRAFSLGDLAPQMAFWNASPFAFSMGFTLVFRRSLLVFARFWPKSIDNNAVSERMAHDQWYFFLSLIFGEVCHNSNDLALYRQHDQNASGLRVIGSKSDSFLAALADRVPEYERLTIAAKNRSMLLHQFVSSEGDEMQAFGPDAPERVMRAMTAFEALHAATERRQNVYKSKLLRQGLPILLDSLIKGDYRRASRWHFTLKGAVRDLLTLPWLAS